MVSSRSMGWRVSEWKATTRMSAPSSGAHVVEHAFGDELEHAVLREVHAVDGRALAQDGQPGGEVRGSDVGHETGLETLAQPFGDSIELAGEAVGGEHELATALVERVEGVEELLLGLGLAGQELHVVDEEHVDVAVGLLEGVERALAQRRDEVVGERLDGRVAHLRAAAEGLDVVADGVQEVGLAEPGRRRGGRAGCTPGPGYSATASAAPWARRLLSPMMNWSKL